MLTASRNRIQGTWLMQFFLTELPFLD
jgi:hypothetical protein